MARGREKNKFVFPRSFLSAVLLISLLLPVQGSAFDSFGPPLGFADIHALITGEALGFLSPGVLQEINAANRGVDVFYPYTPSAHFDDCFFRETSQFIILRYNYVMFHLNPADAANFNATSAASYFGELLHPVQDFYSHSNWAETRPSRILVEDFRVEWPIFNLKMGWSEYDGIVMIQGPIPADVADVFLYADHTVRILKADGVLKDGLISGVYNSPTDCPPGIQIDHGLHDEPGGLNKDNPSKLGFWTAKGLASRQTYKEWCRLANKVVSRYGKVGARRFRDAWMERINAQLLWPDTELNLLPKNCRITGGQPVKAKRMLVD